MKIIVSLLFLILCLPAYADSFSILVGYICDKKADQLTLTYDGAYNEAGKAMIANKNPNQWDPWDLVVVKNERNIESLIPIQRKCRLSDGIYEIKILPSPGNFNIEGACGAAMSARATVAKGKRLVYTVGSFEGRCDNTEPVITRVVIKARDEKPQITTVPYEEFYK